MSSKFTLNLIFYWLFNLQSCHSVYTERRGFEPTTSETSQWTEQNLYTWSYWTRTATTQDNSFNKSTSSSGLNFKTTQVGIELSTPNLWLWFLRGFHPLLRVPDFKISWQSRDWTNNLNPSNQLLYPLSYRKVCLVCFFPSFLFSSSCWTSKATEDHMTLKVQRKLPNTWSHRVRWYPEGLIRHFNLQQCVWL